jgi:hypothetical protein
MLTHTAAKFSKSAKPLIARDESVSEVAKRYALTTLKKILM